MGLDLYSEMVPGGGDGLLYLIWHWRSNLLKVGVTRNWDRRATELQVGRTTEVVLVVRTKTPEQDEDRIHAKWDEYRIPQTEWFCIAGDQLNQMKSDVSKCGRRWKPEEARRRRAEASKERLKKLLANSVGPDGRRYAKRR
jgi:Meiotically up-regulated gene 113